MTSDFDPARDTTRDRPSDPVTGHVLDDFGLPVNGPARTQRLAELKVPDPHTDPEGFRAATARQARPAPGGKPLDPAKE